MFELENGREHFYQWDTNQRIIINDNTVIEAHFCNRTDECSLVCEAYTDGGKRLVDVPNILLQDSLDIRVYAYCGNYTKVEQRYKVIKRTKPADYVYTETEVKRYEDLESRIKAVEEKEVDLSGYYTKAEVDTAIENVEVDLSEYYTKTEVDTAIEENAITPDWNAQEGEQGYIANKTHGIIKGIIEVLPPTTTNAEMEGAILTPLTNPLEVGQKAIVNYNGTDYENEVGEIEAGEDENGNPIIMKYCGNPALAFGDETLDNGMPFVFAEAPAAFQAQGVYAMFVPIDYFESGDAIVSVKVDGTVIHKLDTKYLPKYDWNAEPNTEGHIANRTHYTANVGTLVYDAANLAGVDSVNIAEGQTAYKVSDYILSKEAIQNAELYIAESATGEKVKVEKTEAYETEEYIICSVDSLFIIVFKQLKQTVLGELKVPSTGVYISTNVPYAELVVGEYVKPLDTKYIDTTELATQTEISEINNRISNINGSIININNTITAIRTKLEYEYRLNYDIELKQASSEINLLTEDRQGLYKSLRIKVFIPKAEIEGSCGINIKGRDVNTTKLIISNSISTMEDKYITIDVDGEYKYIDITGTLTNGAGNTSKDIYKLGYSYYMYATSPIYEAKLLTYPTSTESVFPIGTKVKVWGVYAA